MSRMSGHAHRSSANDTHQVHQTTGRSFVGNIRSRTPARATHSIEVLTEHWLRRLHALELSSLDWRPRGQRSCVSLAGEGADIWLIRWPPGTEAPMHDHGGASGALAVVHGELEEEVANLGGAMRRIEKGRVVTLHSEVVHAVRNTRKTDAYSLHLYAPALASMSFYARGQQGSWKLERTEYAGDWT